MRKQIIIIVSNILSFSAFGQISLEYCQQKAETNYPLVKQYELIEQTKAYTVANAAKGYLPQWNISGKASYQSDVTSFPFSVPGVELPVLPKDQYQVLIELQQSIWDGGEIHSRQQETKARSAEATEQLRVSLYDLRDRVNQLYLSVLLLDEQIRQNHLLQENLRQSLENVTAYVANGIANDADLDAVKVELLNVRQQETALTTSRDGYLRMLSLFVGEDITQGSLAMPAAEESVSQEIARPELDYYRAQEHRIDIQLQSLRSKYMPKFGLFAQGAYGNPGLNMLEDKFKPYYIVGVRLQWNFGALYTLRNDRKKLEAERRQIASNRETFLFNTRQQLTGQDAAILSLRKQMDDDDEIVRLRTNIRQAAEAKAANGTLSVLDMLREINRESQARQARAVHEIQLLMEIYKRKDIINEENLSTHRSGTPVVPNE